MKYITYILFKSSSFELLSIPNLAIYMTTSSYAAKINAIESIRFQSLSTASFAPFYLSCWKSFLNVFPILFKNE